MSLDIRAKLSAIRLLAMDVDGVLTDGTIGYDDAGGESKGFHVQDGMGITVLRLAGVAVAWISGRRSDAVLRRARELRVNYVEQGIRDKQSALRRISAALELGIDQVAVIGDDWNDLLAFEAAGVKIAVGNGVAEVVQAADIVTERRGGHGAVREVCDAILEARGLTSDVLARYLASLKETAADGFSDQ